MKDDYQLGSAEEWLKHSNEELAGIIRKRQRQLRVYRFLSLLLLLALFWVVYKYTREFPIWDLWQF